MSNFFDDPVLADGFLGPVLICSPSLSSEPTDLDLHKFDSFCPASHSYAPEPEPSSTCAAFSDGSKGSNAIH
jgi:hypothetical protein